MLYWLENTIRVLPGLMWVFCGLGLPWALVALPRKDWPNRPLVACLTLAFGPALLSVWMFILGTIGAQSQTAMLTLANVLSGTLIVAFFGVISLVWKLRTAQDHSSKFHPLQRDERAILVMIGAAIILVWMTAAYWPFIHYDPLWVYGYQGRLYTLNGFIPNEIGYYPQFLQMLYTYGQLWSGGIIDDHAARAIVPFLHLGSILAVYVLGERLFNRRTGLFAAGTWALYPHVGEWSSVGDLEIPVTYMFTSAAAFFILAWTSLQQSERRRYALIAGVFLGIAMWIKPTAGAFILGVMLLAAVELVRVRGKLSLLRPRFEVVILTGLASVPLGALWYVRNILLGHPPLTFPNDFWPTQAARSGIEFGWPLLLMLLLSAFLTFSPLNRRPNLRLLWLGTVVMVIALLPTIIDPQRTTDLLIEVRRINTHEWGLLSVGIVLFGASLWPYFQKYVTPIAKRKTGIVAWTLLLALPYFVTWFHSYSYHYRLSFPIVPLMLLPVALLLSEWLTWERIMSWKAHKQRAYLLLLFCICLPGVVVVLPRYNAGWDWLWSNRFPTDLSRVATFNGSLALTANKLNNASVSIDNMVVFAPGFQRLPFFLPADAVMTEDTPMRLDEIAHADYFVFTQEAAWLYAEHDLPNDNQVLASMARPNVMRLLETYWDSNFYSLIYRLEPSERRFSSDSPLPSLEADVRFGDLARLANVQLSGTELSEQESVRLRMNWEVVGTTDRDYMIYVHLYDEFDTLIQTWDAPPVENILRYSPDPWITYYSTHLWETGEYIQERRNLRLDRDTVLVLESDQTYRLEMGFYDLETLERVIVTVDDVPVGDGYELAANITFVE